MIAAGIIGGLLSAVFGLVDWWAIPSGTRAKAIGFWHGAGNVVVVLLFIAGAAGVSDSVLTAVIGIAFVVALVLGLKYGKGGAGDAGGGL